MTATYLQTTPKHPILTEPVNLDDWVRHIIDIHFHPTHGAPFWIERARELRINPQKDIRGYRDLALLGFFQIDELRKREVRQFLPAAIAGDRTNLRVYETGGSSGSPARVAFRDYWSHLMTRWMDWYYDNLIQFPREANWLWIGPTGPHVVGDLIRNVANQRGGMCYLIDLDPRFVKLLFQKNDTRTCKLYLEHIQRQAYAILDTQEIHVLGTTPALLQILAPEMSDRGYQFSGLFYAGTQLSKDLYQLLCTEFFPNAIHSAVYGNTLMGVAPLRPYQPDDHNIVYYPLEPFFKIEVVDIEEPNRVLDYRETGRVCFTLLSEELLLPRVLERDQAERWEPLPALGWDGVANVRLFEKIQGSVTEGVY